VSRVRHHRDQPRWTVLAAHPSSSRHRLPLDDTTASVYLSALRRGWLDNVPDVAAEMGLPPVTLGQAIDRLVRLRLLRAQSGAPHRFTPLDPEVAAASLICPLEAEIHRRRDLITRIRQQMNDLRPYYAQEHRSRHALPDVRLLSDAAEAGGRLHQVVSACQHEVRVALPRHTAWAAVVDQVLLPNLSGRPAGPHLRVLYQHSVRADLAARAGIRRMVAAGAEVRTTSHLSRPLLIVDRQTAFALDGSGALELGNALLAGLLADLFTDMWSSALPYSAAEAGYRDAVDDMQKAIARLLAEGWTDEVIARRVGMSLRSCRRHIAELLKNLNATSRFQAGARAVRAGLLAH